MNQKDTEILHTRKGQTAKENSLTCAPIISYYLGK